MIQMLNELLSEMLEARGWDWRSCFSAVVPVPPDGRTVLCECSDGALLEELRRRVERAGGGAAGRVVYRPLPSDPDLPGGMVAASSVADVRRSPAHAAELVTQVVYGDAVEPLKADGDWYLTRLDDGYIGWIHRWHLSELSLEKQEAYRNNARHRVATNHAVVLAGPDHGALPVTDLVVGTVVQAADCGKRGWRVVRLPDGKEGFVVSRAIEKTPVRRRISREGLSATGLRFLGIPYIWGGSTPKGFDCSGLVQRIFRLHGLTLPRDADLQARCGRQLPAGPAAPDATPRPMPAGDLMFFGKTPHHITHVAMTLAERLFLHAHGQVRVGSLDPQSHLYDGRLLSDWQSTRDVITSYNK